jgi:hypothetical protein
MANQFSCMLAGGARINLAVTELQLLSPDAIEPCLGDHVTVEMVFAALPITADGRAADQR